MCRCRDSCESRRARRRVDTRHLHRTQERALRGDTVTRLPSVSPLASSHVLCDAMCGAAPPAPRGDGRSDPAARSLIAHVRAVYCTVASVTAGLRAGRYGVTVYANANTQRHTAAVPAHRVASARFGSSKTYPPRIERQELCCSLMHTDLRCRCHYPHEDGRSLLT